MQSQQTQTSIYPMGCSQVHRHALECLFTFRFLSAFRPCVTPEEYGRLLQDFRGRTSPPPPGGSFIPMSFPANENMTCLTPPERVINRAFARVDAGHLDGEYTDDGELQFYKLPLLGLFLRPRGVIRAGCRC